MPFPSFLNRYSIDFNETCLDIDHTDANADKIPDAVNFMLRSASI